MRASNRPPLQRNEKAPMSIEYRAAVLHAPQTPLKVETVIADERTFLVVRKDAPEAREMAERTDPNA